MTIFQPLHGLALIVAIGATAAACAVLLAALSRLPQNLRRPLIQTVTFLGGLFFAVEFFTPTHSMTVQGSPGVEGNFLTPAVTAFGDISPVIAAFTIGMGVWNLGQLHGRRILRGHKDRLDSAAFFISLFAMTIVGIAAKYHPAGVAGGLKHVLFDGALQPLDATMFSIVAFYIVSAAYRAFRIRSVESTLLLATAVIVMLGQIAIGQMLTNHFPAAQANPLHNFRIEVIRDWILTKANAPATRAIAFGLNVGGLAVAIRIWLGLERGSYFESS